MFWTIYLTIAAIVASTSLVVIYKWLLGDLKRTNDFIGFFLDIFMSFLMVPFLAAFIGLLWPLAIPARILTLRKRAKMKQLQIQKEKINESLSDCFLNT